MVPGRLFEKKTALWVYSMIRDSERRDPGLLYYTNSNELELRVFPVNSGKPAVVEIDCLVPSVITSGDLAGSSNDAAEIMSRIGNQLTPQFSNDGHGHTFLAGVNADTLPRVEREPYLHLIIDRSVNQGYTREVAAMIGQIRSRFPTAKRVRVTFANYNLVDPIVELISVNELPDRLEKDWDKILPLAGGFSLDRAIAHAVYLHGQLDLDGVRARAAGVPLRPVFVILTAKAGARPLKIKFAMAGVDALSELEIDELGADGTEVVHRRPMVESGPILRLGDSIRSLAPKSGTRFNVADKGPIEFWSPGAATWQPLEGVHPTESAEWSHAVELNLRQQDFDASPGDAGFDLRSLVQQSRESGVLLPSTSYIVVENSAQWKMLELSERQKLAQNYALDFKEAPAPSAAVVAAAFALWLAIRRRQRLRGLMNPMLISRGKFSVS